MHVDAKERDLTLPVSQWIRQFQEIVKIVLEDVDSLFLDNSPKSIGWGAKTISDAEMRDNATLSVFETLDPVETFAHAMYTRVFYIDTDGDGGTHVCVVVGGCECCETVSCRKARKV